MLYTANESADEEIIEKLLRFFCEKGEKECFGATLYTCYTYVSPDVALELGWLNGYQNFVLPFFIQNLRQTHLRIAELEKRTAPPKEDDRAQDTIAATYGGMGGLNPSILMIDNGGMGVPETFPMAQGGIDMSGFNQAGMNGGVPPNGMPPQGMDMGGLPNPGMQPQMQGY